MLDEQFDHANDERRERMMEAVLQRIASAPPRVRSAIGARTATTTGPTITAVVGTTSTPARTPASTPASTPAPTPRAWVDITAWRVPALVAAVLVIVVSGVVILKFDASPPPSLPPLGGLLAPLPPPLVRYLATGEVAPMEWLNSYGGRP
ncbi:MAG: hypothetical protein ABJB74_00180 [Gemmatimonas sp.]